MGIKRCPKCGNTRLLARKITGVQVESLETGEFKINAEGSKYQLEIIGCAKCKADFDESQLVEMVQCKKCGNLTEPENLDANGECDVCRVLTERPDLANMSKEDLIRMMLKLEKNTPQTASVPSTVQNEQQVLINENDSLISTAAKEKMKAAQEAINNASNDFSKDIIKETEEELEDTKKRIDEIQQAMNPPVENESKVENEKPKRGRPRKKTETVSVNEENQSNSEEVSEERVEQSANEMSDFQEAPFPEQDNEMKQMFNETEMSQEQPQENTNIPEQSSTPFQMFDEEQSF